MPHGKKSKGHWLQAIGCVTVLFIAGLILFHNYDPRDWAKDLPFRYRVVVMTLIGANVFLPMPSSVVMLTNGEVFHHSLVAFCVSFGGSMLAWISWYWLGRLFGWTGRTSKKPNPPPWNPAVGAGGASGRNDLNGNGPDKISQHVQRYGVGVLIVTRPVPFLAELTAAACGIAHMNFWRFLIGAALGVAPMAAFYTWVAVMAKQNGGTWIAPIVAVLVPAAMYLLIARPWKHRPKNSNH